MDAYEIYNMDTFNISKLIALYISKEITSDEEERLFKWINESDTNRKFFQDFIAKQNFQEYYRIRKEISWEDAYLKSKSGKRYSNRTILRTLVKYAAIFLIPVCVFSGLYLYEKSRSGDAVREMLSATAPIIIDNSNAKITLTLANGHVIDVKKGKIDSVTAGETGLSLGKNQIEYSGTHSREIKYNTLSIARGGQYRIKLADSTFVHLNSASELKYPIDFAGAERHVFLKGEAWFEVTKDTKPFIVETSNLTVKVYGTKFAVNTNVRNVEQVVLASGSVGVSTIGGTKEVRIQPNQLAELSLGPSEISVSEVDVYNYIAWRDNVFVFESKTLSDIARVLENSYDIDFVFEDEGAKQLRYSGFLNKYEDFSIILSSLQKTLSAKFEYANKKVIVKK